MGRISDSIFQGRSTDALIVEDAYNISSGETRNSLFDTVKGIFGDAVQGLKSNKNSIRELAQLVADSKNGYVDRMQMFDRALGAMGSSLPSLFGQLGGTLKNKLSLVSGDLIGPNAEKTFAVLYGNAELLIRSADATSLDELTQLVQELTGNSELMQLINIEAESAVIAGIASTLLDFGIPDLIDDVMEMSRYPQVKTNAYAWLSSQAVAGSNLDMIERAINEIGLVKFLEYNPDAINMVLSSYYLGSEDGPAQYPALRTRLISVLNKIDPKWRMVKRNGADFYSLAPYVSASEQAKTVLRIAEPDRTLVAIVGDRTPRAAGEVIKELYPTAYIS